MKQPSVESSSDLDRLIDTLHVEFDRLAECLVSPGWRLTMPSLNLPGIHYNVSGTGSMKITSHPEIELVPHTLVICPPRRILEIRAHSNTSDDSIGSKSISQWPEHSRDDVNRFVAGSRKPEITLICGYFRASHGTSMDLFANLPMPIVETFSAEEQLDKKLAAALDELMARQIGAGAMSSALLKQVLITIMRRSLTSADRWTARFAALSDPKIARALAEMVSKPGKPHTMQTLAQLSGMSRSAFAARFTAVLGAAPMSVLRELRMRHARTLLTSHGSTVKQAAAAVGYSSWRAFLKAYRRAYGPHGTT